MEKKCGSTSIDDAGNFKVQVVKEHGKVTLEHQNIRMRKTHSILALEMEILDLFDTSEETPVYSS